MQPRTTHGALAMRNKTIELTVRMSPAMRRILDKMATRHKRSVAGLVRRILADHLRNHGFMTEEELKADTM